ncbi:MAG: hypothetical protein A2X30_02235 [Elusimicrobia bacterium GWB2_63_16]|nr:MAG: hypothetical protein A2X30_02235 [Elusimicrobia bacterium GWB2_63_16]
MKKLMTIYMTGTLGALLALAGLAQAGRPEIVHEDIFVAKGETLRGDIATDKSITVDGLLKGDAVSVGGASVTVNGEVTGDLVSMGGAVAIPGTVRGDVSSIGGPVDVSGRVGGNLSAVGGKVTLSGTGQVDGEISALGGGVEKGPNAVHKGSVNSFSADAIRGTLTNALGVARTVGRYNRDSSTAGPRHSRYNINYNWRGEDNGGFRAFWLFALLSMLLTGVAVVTLPAIFFPANVENMRAAIDGDIWKTGAIGALALVALFPGLLMLTVSILGIPLVPFAMLGYAAAAVLGLSAFSVILQRKFFEGIKRPGPAGLAGRAAAGAGLIAAMLFVGKLVPFVGGLLALIGLMLLAFGAMAGLGAAWMTRMGARPAAGPAPAAPAQPQLPPVQPQ